jgi:hypothetical protein
VCFFFFAFVTAGRGRSAATDSALLLLLLSAIERQLTAFGDESVQTRAFKAAPVAVIPASGNGSEANGHQFETE